MNKNNKENEYNIIKDSSNQIEISNNYPVVPLVNDQTIKLQDMNEKGFSNMNWPNGVVTTLNVIGTIISLCGANKGAKFAITVAVGATVGATAGALVGAAILIIAAIIPLLWKPDDPNPKEVWESLTTSAEELLDKKISENNKILALAELDSLRRSLAEYVSAVENYNSNPKDINAKNILIDKFSFTYNILVNRMSVFKPKGDEVLLLSVYAEAANIHLLIIRDAIIYADKLELDKNYYHTQLLNYTEEYIEHCIKWYKKGLEELKEKLCNKQLNEKPITKAKNWKKYNDYRNLMTTTVLDIISLFSNYDADKYPVANSKLLPVNKENVVSIELTRELYTSPTGYECAALNTDSLSVDLEDKFTRNPHLFSWLEKIEYFSHKNLSDRQKSYLVGNSNWYYYTNNSKDLIPSVYINSNIIPSQGEEKLQDSIDIKDVCIYRMKSTYSYDENIMHINLIKRYFSTGHRDNQTIYDVNVGKPAIRTNILDQKTQDFQTIYDTSDIKQLRSLKQDTQDFYVPMNTKKTISYKNYSHQLSHMLTYPINENLITSVFAWTHIDINRENTIYKDGITQISAVKAYNIWSGTVPGEVIKGPGHTGGDLVKLQLSSSMKFEFTFENELQEYKIRLRYAAKENVFIHIYGSYKLENIMLKKTELTDEKNLKYKVFDYQDLFKTSKKPVKDLEIFANGDVFFDKIEFIPLP